MERKFRVRFNLGRGPRYKTWKITYPDGYVDYLEPSQVTLVIKNAKLYNRREAAEEIFNGANKRVCAWITAEDVEVLPKNREGYSNTEVTYNPRKAPYWQLNGFDVDTLEIPELTTVDNRVFLSENRFSVDLDKYNLKYLQKNLN